MTLAGPTYLAPILKALLDYVIQCQSMQMYHVMLILTDGEFFDKV